MKNLFLVINKEKIYAYVVSILTICTLFFVSGVIKKDLDNTESISSNIIEENRIKIEENNVENELNNNSETTETSYIKRIN